ncbi:tyrosine-protein phosphatase [Amnibacterium endophyticum]|uniref:Tyrosine-protein phosphatase n=1 Tax=Amnibacterium endophyticum TaxID=2109337 RepID=A0ABW4LEA8_9MICO
MSDRALDVPGLVNGRDLGGLPLVGGGSTPHGVLLRSERPDRLDGTGWRRLHETGVRTVVDLRLPVEREDHPVAVPAHLATRHVDLDGLENAAFWADYWDNGLSGTPVYYLPHLAAMPERVVAVLAAIATAPPGGVLFHCAGGRDRTGLVAAVLLTAAGVEPDAIVDDYLESVATADALAGVLGVANPNPAIDALLAGRGTTSERAFRDFLAGLDVEALLDRLPAQQADAIRSWRGALPGQRE